MFFKRGNFSCDNLKISLVSSSDTILPGLSAKLVSMSHQRLKYLGINVITNTKLLKCNEDHLELSNGTKIYHSFIIFTGGIEASTITSQLDVEKNARGQIIVNEYLQSDKYENIFAIGDMAQIKNKKGEIMPPNVTIARISGTTAGKNVLSKIAGKSMIKSNPKLDGILIALGGKYAAGDIFGILTVKGRIAYEIKKYVFSSYRKPLLKLIKIGYNKLKRL